MEAAGNQFFVFSIGNSLFAIDALAVRETFSLPKITPLEETPPYVVGVINLRGETIPILDLNILFGRTHEAYRLDDGVIVLEANGQLAGIIVNDVQDVMEIAEELIDPPPFPDLELDAPLKLVTGVAKVDEELIMVLDHERLMAHGEWFELLSAETAGEESEPDEVSLAAPHPLFAGLSPESLVEFQRRASDLLRKDENEVLEGLLQVAVVVLGGEYFALDVGSIREFSPLLHLTPLPNCPEHVIGSMNLRGSILTVIDIRGLLGLPPRKFSRSAKVVVTSVDDSSVGIAIDDIHDIAHVHQSDILPLPASVRLLVGKYTQGTAFYEGRAMTLLNVPEILREESLIVNDLQ